MVLNIKSFYTTVLSQALSPCENFLAAGTNFGNINIFKYSIKYLSQFSYLSKYNIDNSIYIPVASTGYMKMRRNISINPTLPRVVE